MSFVKPIGIGLLLLAGQISASAADLAILKNGSTIPFLRREQAGTLTRLYIPGGHMDIPTSEIASYDKDDTPLTEPADITQPAPETAATATLPLPGATQVSRTPPAALAREVNIDEVVREASSRHQLDPDFVASVIKAESNFKAHAVSPKGAQGLMQLMPRTAAQLGVKDAFDPRSNVEAGTAHLSALLDQYNNDPIKALAAYNAGAHRVQQYHGVPPYRETRAYVAKIVRDFNAKKRAQMKAAAAVTGKTSVAASKTAAAGTTKASQKAPAKKQASLAKPGDPA
jgi:Transglycosylase SLT domain